MIKPLYYLNICYTELLKSRGSTKMPNEFDRTEIQKKTCFTLHSSFEEAITQTKNKTICLYWRWPINWLRLVLSLCIVDGQNKNTRGEMIHQISHHSKHIYPLPCAPPPSFACIFEVSIVDPRLLLLIQIICIIQIIIQDYNYNLTDRRKE